MASLEENLRRIYYNFVVGRSRVRMIDTKSVEALDEPPIFIISAYRSGSTLLRYIIDSHSKVACPPETDFLLPLAQLIKRERYLAGFTGLGFDRQAIIQRLRKFVIDLYGNYSRSLEKSRWADKSPAYIDCLDFILEIFPEAQFVMLYRNGLDQSHSFTRGGRFTHEALSAFSNEEHDLRVAAIKYWSHAARQMLDFEYTNPHRCFRVRYEDLCEAPENVLQQMFHFLHLEWEPAVLHFHKFPHDAGREGGRVIATTGFSPRTKYYCTWPTQLLITCQEIAELELKALAYTVDETR